SPAGSKNEIPGMHRDALALHGGVGAFALDDEAQRIRRVPVRGRDLAGLYHLQPAIKRVGDVAGTGETRVLQNEYAPLCFLRGDQLDCPQELRAHIAITPNGWNG